MRPLPKLGLLLTIAACHREAGPSPPAAETDAGGHTDTAAPDDTDPVVDTDPGLDTDDTDDTDADTPAEPGRWEWGRDNAPADAGASLVGGWGEMAGVCLLGLPDTDGNGGEDLLVAAPYYDGQRGRVFLVPGRSAWGMGEPLASKANIEGEATYDQLCQAVPGNYDGDGLTDVLFDTGYTTGGWGRFPLVRGGTWSAPTAAAAHVDQQLGSDTLFANLPGEIGDIDGDGLDDAWFTTSYDGGQALIVPGSALRGDTNAPDVAMSWVAADSGRRTSFASLTGDVTGDGKSDLLAWYRDEDPVYAAVIAPGFDTGSTAPRPLEAAPSTTIACAAQCFPSFIGDLDADGIGDLWIGEEGVGYVFLGRDDWPATLDLADADHTAAGLGELLPVGDLSGDGVPDFAQVAQGPTYDSDVLVWFGGGPWPAALDAAGADVVIAGGTASGGIWRDPSGRVPDLDGDGLADLVLGNGGAEVGGDRMAGAISVFVGRAAWPATLTAADADVRFVGSGPYAWMGMYLHGLWTAIADLDADGFDDLVTLDGLSGETVLFLGRARP